MSHPALGIQNSYKIILVGASSVGKTALIMKLLGNTINDALHPTIGVEFYTHPMEINGERVQLQIWDTAGQERFRAMSRAYFRNALGAILVFDTTNRATFDEISLWLNDLHQLSFPNSVVLLVGNKNDLREKREIGIAEAVSFAKNHNLEYIDTSAVTGDHVEDTFMRLAMEIMARIKSGDLNVPNAMGQTTRQIVQDPMETDTPDRNSSGCC